MIFQHLVLLVACAAAVVMASPLQHSDEVGEEEEDHGLFLSNDSSATADAASGAKNSTVELSGNDTSAASNATDANTTMMSEHLERSENATFRFVDGDPSAANSNSSSSTALVPAVDKEDEEHKEDAVEEAEDATKMLPEDRNSSTRLLNQTRAAEEETPAPLEGDEPDAKTMTTGEGGAEDKVTTEKTAAGLKDDEHGAVLPLTTSARPLTLSAHPLEKDEEASAEPSVLQMHPVLKKKNRTIAFRSGEADEWRPYVDDMTAFLEPYSKEAQERNVHCDFEKSLPEGQACRFDLVYLGPSCTKENNFGYGIGKPCVLISPGHFADWVPSPYDNDTMANVPDEVQRLIRIFTAGFMFMTCEGESESDRANIGPMAYLPPYQGFPSYFFPNRKDTVSSYVSPLMAIEFLNPTNGTLINVLCKAWAKNVGELTYPVELRFSLQVN